MTQPNIFKEVEDDLERQKLEAMWRQYGPYVIAAAVFIVIVTASITSWRSWNSEKHKEATGTLFALQAKSTTDKAALVAELHEFAKKNGSSTQAVFADFNAAEVAAGNGETAKAVEILDAVAANTKVEKAFRQYADVLSVTLQMDAADTSNLMPRLEPVMASGSPWRFSALELGAFLAFKNGDKAKAKELFSRYANDAEAPRTLAERASDMLRYIGE